MNSLGCSDAVDATASQVLHAVEHGFGCDTLEELGDSSNLFTGRVTLVRDHDDSRVLQAREQNSVSEVRDEP